MLSQVLPSFARIPFEAGHAETYIRRMYRSRGPQCGITDGVLLRWI
jgi:hypothetical protein